MISFVEALIKPLRITIDANNSVRVYHMRPVVIITLTLLLLAAAVAIGVASAPQEQQTTMLAQVAHLQHEQKRLNGVLSETEAMLSLRDGQIEGLKQEMVLLRSEKLAMQKRLEVFDDVLAARKVKGIHFLRPQFVWQDKQLISYKMILVKGENYPRWIIGQLKFSVTDSLGNVLFLNNEKGKDSHTIEMTTHEYVEGTLVWAQQWQPEKLTVSLINHLGVQTDSIEIPISNNHGSRQTDATMEQTP